MIFQVHSENMRKCGYGGIGRRAGFRYQWASRAGSSPVIRIPKKHRLMLGAHKTGYNILSMIKASGSRG